MKTALSLAAACLCLFLARRGLSAVVVYPAPTGAPLSTAYGLKVEGREVPVYDGLMNSRNAAFAYFDISGCVQVQVACLRGISKFKVRPFSAGIKATVSGNQAGFRLGRPRTLVLEANGMDLPLFLFANPLEANPPKPGAPGLVYFGPGIHKPAKPITLGSNQTLYIAGGAMVYGQVAVKDGSSNVMIRGRGVLCGIGLPRKWREGSMVTVWNSKAVALQDIILAGAVPAAWTCILWQTDSVLVDNLKIMGQDGWSCDGIDVVSCHAVEIRNSFIYTYDDCIAIKAYAGCKPKCPARSSRWVNVHDNLLANTWGRGVDIGFELFSGTADPVQDITVRDNDFIYGAVAGHPALGIHNGGDSLVQKVLFQDNRVEDPLGTLLEFRILSSEWSQGFGGQGQIRDIKVVNLCQVSGNPLTDNQKRGKIAGYDPKHTVEGVAFSGFSILGYPGGPRILSVGPFASGVEFQNSGPLANPTPAAECGQGGKYKKAKSRHLSPQVSPLLKERGPLPLPL